MNIENISKYLAAIPTLFLCVLMTSLSALSFIIVITENPLSIFDIALLSVGLMVSFMVMIFALEKSPELFATVILYVYAFLIALALILFFVENSLYMFNIVFMCVGLIATFTILLLSLEIFQELFSTIIFYFLVFLIQSAALVKTMIGKIKNHKKTKGAE